MPTPHQNGIDPRLLDHLPTLPGTAVEFLRLCEDPHSGVVDVAGVAERDPALLARILQVANSPFYSPREPVVDAVRASAILGLRNLKMIGVGFAVLGELWTSFDRSPQLSGIMGASALAGSGARSFSARLGTGRDEEALTSGLLSYIGELALLRHNPDEFSDMWAEANGLPSVRTQRQVFGTDGAEVGRLLLERWQIPGDLRDGVVARSESLDQRLRRSPDVYGAAVGFGTAIADLLAAHEGDAIEVIRPFARRWGLADDDLMGFWADFRLAVRHADQQLGSAMGADLDKIITEARDEYLTSSVHAHDQLVAAQREIDELRSENERLEDLSLSDPLTGAPNRAAFEQRLRADFAAMARGVSERGVAIAMFDLDHFKSVNDVHGHLIGDAVLSAIADAGQLAVRTDELFVRLGGDEFAMVLRPASDEELNVATERLRRAMSEAAHSVAGGEVVTVSGGSAAVWSTRDQTEDAAALKRSADSELYKAKRAGRDRSSVAASGGDVLQSI